VTKPIAAPIVGDMITSTIHVLILVPVFFLLIKRRARRRARLDELKGLADLNPIALSKIDHPRAQIN
jgi:hypothetical protein